MNDDFCSIAMKNGWMTKHIMFIMINQMIDISKPIFFVTFLDMKIKRIQQ